MDDLKINYTSGAKKELETLIDDIKKQIEDSCVKDKYVAGDSCVEITAFDIENKKKQIAFQSTKRHKDLFGAYMLIIIGLIIMLVSFLYSIFHYVRELFLFSTISRIFILFGLTFFCAGLLIISIILIKRLRLKREFPCL